ncbi:hypothetical protein NP493_1646g00001 [Ridgeia piscesae]|uniref:Uncharacterized protein n=1 Tax=Ridgeia piscesae TaxID=27915 RepID=A0AAD9JWN3_RIDPI|nr:hypothetical protein NP493_1646g00001 [Ridgeia piscesae]
MDRTKTLTDTLFKTAKIGLGFNAGTGTMLEISARADGRSVRVTGYGETLESLQLPVAGLHTGSEASGATGDQSSPGAVTELGNGYLSVLLQDGELSRWELNDYLNGLNWTLSGYSVVNMDGVLHCNEMWTKLSPKEKRTKSAKLSK